VDGMSSTTVEVAGWHAVAVMMRAAICF
jgi:hypothetical protein